MRDDSCGRCRRRNGRGAGAGALGGARRSAQRGAESGAVGRVLEARPRSVLAGNSVEGLEAGAGGCGAGVVQGDGDGNPVGDSRLLSDQGLLLVQVLEAMVRASDGLANKAGNSQGEKGRGIHRAGVSASDVGAGS